MNYKKAGAQVQVRDDRGTHDRVHIPFSTYLATYYISFTFTIGHTGTMKRSCRTCTVVSGVAFGARCLCIAILAA